MKFNNLYILGIIIILFMQPATAYDVVDVTSYIHKPTLFSYNYPVNVSRIQLNTDESVFSMLTYYPPGSYAANQTTCTSPAGFIESFDIVSRYPFYGKALYNGSTKIANYYYIFFKSMDYWNLDVTSFIWDQDNASRILTSRCDGLISYWEFPVTHNLINFSDPTPLSLNSMKLLAQVQANVSFQHIEHYSDNYLGFTDNEVYLIYANLSVTKLDIPIIATNSEYIQHTHEIVGINASQLYITDITNKKIKTLQFPAAISKFTTNNNGAIIVQSGPTLYYVSVNRDTFTEFTTPNILQSISFSTNNSFLVGVSDNYHIQLWNASTYKLIRTYNMLYKTYNKLTDQIEYGKITNIAMDSTGYIHFIQDQLMQFDTKSLIVSVYRDGQQIVYNGSTSSTAHSANASIILFPAMVIYIVSKRKYHK